MDQEKQKGIRWGIGGAIIVAIMVMARFGYIPTTFPALMGVLAEALIGFVAGYLLGVFVHRPAKAKQ